MRSAFALQALGDFSHIISKRCLLTSLAGECGGGGLESCSVFVCVWVDVLCVCVWQRRREGVCEVVLRSAVPLATVWNLADKETVSLTHCAATMPGLRGAIKMVARLLLPGVAGQTGSRGGANRGQRRAGICCGDTFASLQCNGCSQVDGGCSAETSPRDRSVLFPLRVCFSLHLQFL